MMKRLSELYFGELEAHDEARLHSDYFKKCFVAPNSMTASTLRNDRKFKIIGRKGSGKTAVQMHLAEQLKNEGYLIHQFRFFYDLRGADYADAAQTQSEVSFSNISNDKNIFVHYDFRDIWERILLLRLGQTLVEGGINNDFTNFCVPPNAKYSNIFDGILKGLNLQLEGEMLGIAGKVGLNFDNNGKPHKIKVNTFNKIARDLLKTSTKGNKVYFFVDELVFSRLDGKEDEVSLKAAMVRDLLRTCWELNNFCADNKLDIHFICSLRPEVRNLINDLDSEAGKFLDGKDVTLSWLSREGPTLLLTDLIKNRVRFSDTSSGHEINAREIVASHVTFGKKNLTFEEFILQNTWCRPRDLVRLLIEIQKASPNSTLIGETEIKNALDGYSRSSAKELIDELGVRFGRPILEAMKSSISKREYRDIDEFWSVLSRSLGGANKDQVIGTLFDLGFIGGITHHPTRTFWAHRGENSLKSHHKITIHPALWNELSIRSQ